MTFMDSHTEIFSPFFAIKRRQFKCWEIGPMVFGIQTRHELFHGFSYVFGSCFQKDNQNQQNHMSFQRKLRSACAYSLIKASLYAWGRFGFSATQRMPSKVSDQTEQLHRLFWVFPGGTHDFVSSLCFGFWLSYKVLIQEIWAVTWQTNKMACVPSEDSDQPGHPPSLIRVFSVGMKKLGVLSYPMSAQRRLWSDWADTQADLSLHWAHTHFVGFVMLLLINWHFLLVMMK